ncbi:MAG: NRDE family protein [Bacteroidota bacterium]|nr:NRDE family protein [Bacteroidota bacterium]
MCTVTYIPPTEEKVFILSSNRDEKVFRPTLAPAVYENAGLKICYPRDTKAGGSWIAINDNGRLCCLLNGAYEAHQKKDFHTLSRGKVLVELASSRMGAFEFFSKKDLSAVEPFTIITIDKKNLKIETFNEFIWDGQKKHYRFLDANQAHLWSSVTLYNKNVRKIREQWFQNFLATSKIDNSPENVMLFHSGKHTSDKSLNLVMEGNGGLKTVSITQVIPRKKGFKMEYSDLISNHKTMSEL